MLLLLISSLVGLSHTQQFRAAVYEHELVVPSACLDRVCSRQEAIELMEINLAVLEEQIVEAANQGM